MQAVYDRIASGGDAGLAIVQLDPLFGDRKAAKAAVDQLRAEGRIEGVGSGRGARYRVTARAAELPLDFEPETPK